MGAGVTPAFIAITGPSGSGKTTLARALCKALGARATELPLDAYYRDLRRLPPEERAATNFDDPAAIEWPLFRRHIEQLAAGRAVERPRYSYVTHTREQATSRVEPRPYVILEGLFALHDAAVRRRLRLSVFLDADGSLCLARRLARDAAERGRRPEATRRQFTARVWPMALRHVLPLKASAGLVLHGDLPLDDGVRAITERLRRT
jgi:uridine kinase